MQSTIRQLMKSSKVGVVIKETSLYDISNSAYSSSKREEQPNVMSDMMAGLTIEVVMEKWRGKLIS